LKMIETNEKSAFQPTLNVANPNSKCARVLTVREPGVALVEACGHCDCAEGVAQARSAMTPMERAAVWHCRRLWLEDCAAVGRGGPGDRLTV
jgi:hypothetical protein